MWQRTQFLRNTSWMAAVGAPSLPYPFPSQDEETELHTLSTPSSSRCVQWELADKGAALLPRGNASVATWQRKANLLKEQ